MKKIPQDLRYIKVYSKIKNEAIQEKRIKISFLFISILLICGEILFNNEIFSITLIIGVSTGILISAYISEKI